MKLLLSFVNSTLSLAGFDWDKGVLFWGLPAQVLPARGIAYQGRDLLISSDHVISRVSEQGWEFHAIRGPHLPELHTIRAMDDALFGVIDTGHSLLRILDRDWQDVRTLSPIRHWNFSGEDAVHLNDFEPTPHGILASCFDYRPWRRVIEDVRSPRAKLTGRSGLILNLTADDDAGAGRIVGCGFSRPHSMSYYNNYLYVCSSGTGLFHVCDFNSDGTLVERRRYSITNDRFLRGAWRSGEGWYLGGSSMRLGGEEHPSIPAAVFRLDESTGTVEKRELPGTGEIYDILPWDAGILDSIVSNVFSRLTPPTDAPAQPCRAPELPISPTAT